MPKKKKKIEFFKKGKCPHGGRHEKCNFKKLNTIKENNLKIQEKTSWQSQKRE